MGILTRIIRLCKADIHGVMDQLEDKGLLLKQHLREMEQIISQKEAHRNSLIVTRSRLEKERKSYEKQREKLEQDIASAIKREKDDIARMLIKRNRPLTNLADELEGSIKRLDEQIEQIEEGLKQQQLCYEKIKHRSDEYLYKTEQQRWEKSVPPVSVNSIYNDPSSEEIELELFQRKEALKGGEAA